MRLVEIVNSPAEAPLDNRARCQSCPRGGRRRRAAEEHRRDLNSTADDTGRRYLIGVAAAAQSGVFAVWIGFALVLGFPDRKTTVAHLFTLPLNCAIGVAACASHALMGLRKGSARTDARRRG